MDKIYYFYTGDCAYCHQAEEAMNMIRFEHPEYSSLQIEKIDAGKQKERVKDFGCTDTPQIFSENGKLLYEASAGDTYRQTKKKLEDIFRDLD